MKSCFFHRPDGQQGIWNHWLTDTEDWCVSRQLWWGHRIPAFFIPAACSSPVLLARASGLSTSAPSRVFVHDGVVWAIAPDAASAASEIRQVLLVIAIL